MSGWYLHKSNIIAFGILFTFYQPSNNLTLHIKELLTSLISHKINGCEHKENITIYPALPLPFNGGKLLTESPLYSERAAPCI